MRSRQNSAEWSQPMTGSYKDEREGVVICSSEEVEKKNTCKFGEFVLVHNGSHNISLTSAPDKMIRYSADTSVRARLKALYVSIGIHSMPHAIQAESASRRKGFNRRYPVSAPGTRP